ncbi:hypothetical protein QO014_002288 [Kaistia dalseonensis]|uniref:Uncharacterized protein n=1 Tax=Kaistia dalseonensis TaxID=410840 RepID=A0ABU0H6H4_9HYPH|nr:hypothetical protein [Kaistia dalseonensis]
MPIRFSEPAMQLGVLFDAARAGEYQQALVDLSVKADLKIFDLGNKITIINLSLRIIERSDAAVDHQLNDAACIRATTDRPVLDQAIQRGR